MRDLRMVLVFCALILGAQACGGDEGGGGDGGAESDSGAVDSGAGDASSDAAIDEDSSVDDAGSDAAIADAGSDAAIADAGSDAAIADAGLGVDSGTMCSDELGAPCDDTTPCAESFACNLGRCAPQGRDVCGGFAGWTCPRPGGAAYTECRYYEGADFGPCLTPAEAACVCARPDPGFSCP